MVFGKAVLVVFCKDGEIRRIPVVIAQRRTMRNPTAGVTPGPVVNSRSLFPLSMGLGDCGVSVPPRGWTRGYQETRCPNSYSGASSPSGFFRPTGVSTLSQGGGSHAGITSKLRGQKLRQKPRDHVL